jgi:nitric-oxide synthase
MHGLIFVTWEKYLAERFQGSVLKEYRDAIGETPETVPLPSRVYKDAVLLAGVATASKITHIPAEDLLREFGRVKFPSDFQGLQRLPSPALRQVFSEARDFLHLFHYERETPHLYQERMGLIQAELEATGTYHQTYEELAYGARVAWRNSSRCIGRLHWKVMEVCDKRHLKTAEEIFEALVEHIVLATNGGKIRPMITIFAQQGPGQEKIRIWNPQLIRYAGYCQPNGAVIGDPSNVGLTEVIRRLGWQGGSGSPFDCLPIVIQMPSQAPRFFELPRECILEVPLSHPNYPWFAQLGLKWHALPVISNMCLEIGGLSYNAAPFNGWYMGTEIGARNLGDAGRYNLLPIIAQRMGLDTSTSRTLWQDRAIVELNVAVLYSFTKQHVAIVDHHTASRQFLLHGERERQAGRQVCADWGWIVPPISGSVTPVFHHSYQDVPMKPNFFYQPDPWHEPFPWDESFGCVLL